MRSCSACKEFGGQDETSIGQFIANSAPESLTIQGAKVPTAIWGGINIDDRGLPVFPVRAMNIFNGKSQTE